MEAEVGAIVKYVKKRWVVYKDDPKVRTVILRDWDDNQVEVANDDPEVKLISVSTRWPFLLCKINTRAGPIRQLLLTRGGSTTELTPLKDWVPSDLSRAGGSLYIHPRVELRTGEVLVAVHATGARSRVNVTKSFGSKKQRQNRINTAIPERQDPMSLLEDDDALL